ncbi:hypothetical protein MmiHf6_06490 [Methanimicrococcus hongohii]|uniref:PKD domain-containing protein n=1 Tax=Methanimicrococcus hongohii TaxID=3028295 RepID=A0AA96VAC4_9EURY|nr:PKD domain-containing protein [Methanimicrococcus sp. Hf6]WNY23342.1 hypothetical protein MmiHf6_06490 [Methanimicrococcus sp. Hf6]
MKRTAANISSLTVLGALLLLFLISTVSAANAAGDGFINVDVNTSPQFDGSVLKGVAPLEVSFNTWMPNHTSGTTYSWDFGDGSTSTERSPTHTYSRTGTFTVKLTVTNSSGTFTTEKSDYIKAGTIPVALFDADEVQGIAPLKVRFTDQSTGDPESWYWEFGDGNTSVVQSPEYVYKRSGSYNVTLTVKNEFGSSTLLRTSDGKLIYLSTGKAGSASGTDADAANADGNASGSAGADGSGSNANASVSNGTIITDATNGTTVIDGAANGTSAGSSDSHSPEEPLPETAVPGFSVVAAVLAVAGIAALLYRRK